MTTNSTYGWPIITKADMYKPTTISAAQGAAFDNRVTLERARHEKRVASVSALPGTGDYVGQAAWVNNINMPYYWAGSAWKPANGVEGGWIHFSSVNWAHSAMPIRWTNVLNISLPSGRFTASPNVVVNGYSTDRVVWASVAGVPSTTSVPVRLMCVAPGGGGVRVYWVATDSN